MKSTWWVKFLGLLVLNLILVGPIWGKESPADEPTPITDTGRFLEEYQSAGALKFFENSEDVLRLAQFERALMRFRFLKGQIQKKGAYSSLEPMVDMRLHWLKKQMHLQNWQVAAIPPPKATRLKAKPAVIKPPPPPPAKPKNPDEAEADKKEAVIFGAPSPAPKAAPAPVATAPKPTEAAAPLKAKDEEKTEDSKEGEEKETKPAPLPPGFLEKLKIRLHLKKKVE